MIYSSKNTIFIISTIITYKLKCDMHYIGFIIGSKKKPIPDILIVPISADINISYRYRLTLNHYTYYTLIKCLFLTNNAFIFNEAL